MEIYNADCISTMKEMADNSIDLTVTSPPYDNLRNYNGNIAQWDFEKFKAVAEELYRITKKGGTVVWIVSDSTVKGSETGTSFRQALYFMECGFRLHDTMIWQKDTASFPCNIRYFNVFEYMFIFSKGKPKAFNPIMDRKNKWYNARVHGTYRNIDGSIERRNYDTKISEYGCRFNVWNIPSEKNNRTNHPAVFPLQLARDHVISWSNEHDVVLDPFMGSGTTGIACAETNRRFIGIELDEQYFDTAKKRIEESMRRHE